MKQKRFRTRRRTTRLKHLCDKNYMSIGLTLLKMKWTVAVSAVTVVATGGRARAAGGGALRGQWLWTFDGRGGDTKAVDVFLMQMFPNHSHVYSLALIVALNFTLTPDQLLFFFSYVSR